MQPAHKKVKWSFIENILEKETWKRHKKLELEDKKRREKLELEKKIRSFIRKPMESYRKVKNSMYRYIDHVSYFFKQSILNGYRLIQTRDHFPPEHISPDQNRLPTEGKG